MTEKPSGPAAGAPGAAPPLDEIAAATASVPELTDIDPAAIGIVPLPGLTNRVFRLDTAAGRFVLRLPRPETAGSIDRAREAQNARAAEAIGIGAEILFCDIEGGVMVTRAIPDVVPLGVAPTPDQALRAGRVFGRLHRSGADFSGEHRPLGFVESYAATLAAAGRLPEETVRLHLAAQRVAAALAAGGAGEAPCHCDPVPDNLLDDGARMWLIDWEYSARTDPAWDLAYFALEAELDAEAEAALLSGYGEGAAPNPTSSPASSLDMAPRVGAMKLLVDLVSGLWSLCQDLAGNPAADFRAAGQRRLARAVARVEAEAFAAALASLERAGG